jgi:protein-L-isoaspartate(D-aspartate) O-methyltransferase
MTSRRAASAAQGRLMEHIDRVVAANGVAGGLRPALRSALQDCPRHLFVDRYQLGPMGAVLDAAIGRPEDHYDLIYQDIALGHVDSAGRALPSTNSPPSTSLYFLERLDLRPGQTVLEVGCGSGWTLALIARAVGPSGHAVGVEVIPELAEQAKRALAGAGITNATVFAADGAEGVPAKAPFDRVIFTTSIWSLPVTFFGQVGNGARLVAPFQIRGPGVDVLALDRDVSGEFRAAWATSSFFVRGTGGLAAEAPLPQPLSSMTMWAELANQVVFRVPMPLGTLGSATARGSLFGACTMAFRSYLTKTEPDMRVFAAEHDDLLPPFVVLGDPTSAMHIAGFGIVDEARRSLAICYPGEMVGYGNPSAAHRLLAAYRAWTDLMMPGVEAFDLVLRKTPRASAPPAGAWTETRGETTFVWSLKTDWPRASRLGAG